MAKDQTVKMITTLMTVTPTMAASWLAAFNTSNRTVRRRWVDTLATIIKEDKWHVTHQGIAFNCDGTLLDGQHRLMAIVAAGIPVQMMVTRNVDKEAMYAIDQGKTRSVPDVANTLGTQIKSQHVAVARMMFYRGQSDISKARTTTSEALIGFISQHIEPITFAMDKFRSNAYRHAAIQSVVARAWYTANHERLEDFAKTFNKGFSTEEEDSAALRLRGTFERNRKIFHSSDGRFVLYRKTQAALSAFLEFRPIDKVYEAAEEMFLLPGEKS
jgi:hypothetical protein